MALLIGRGAFSFGVHGRRNSVHHRACGVAGRLRVDAVVEVGTRLDEHAHTADVAVLHGHVAAGRCREMSGDMGRYGEIWGDKRCV